MSAPPVEPTTMQRTSPVTADAALVADIGRGSREALAEAYGRHSGAMLAVARRLLADPDQADDVVRQAFLHLWSEPTQVSPGAGSLRADLVAECHRQSVHRLRMDDAQGGHQDGAAVDPPVGDVLADLSADERGVIETAYFGGHTYRETATMLGCSDSVVKDWMHSGMVRLRTGLERRGGPQLSS